MNDRKHLRRGLGCILVLGLLWVLASCASTGQTGGSESAPATGKLEKISIPDEELRTAMVGTWIQEKAALFRFERTYHQDGRSDARGTVISVAGTQDFKMQGTWKIENGVLLVKNLSVEPATFASAGVEHRDRIVSFRNGEMVIAPERGEKFTIRKVPPVSPLMAEFRDKTRLMEYLASIRDDALANYDKSIETMPAASRLPTEAIAMQRAVLRIAYSPERMAESVLRDTEAGMTPEEIRAIIAWEDSPVGRKSNEVSLSMLRPEKEPLISAYIAGLRVTPPPAERLRIAEEMDRTLKETEAATSLLFGLQVAKIVGSNALLPPDRAIPLDKVSEEVEKQRPKTIAMVQPLVIGRNLYSMQALTDAELKELFQFHMSDAGKKYNDVSNAAMQKAIFASEALFWQSLAEAVKTGKARKGT